MIDSRMKWCLPVAAFALFFASLQVTAEVGQKPFPKIEGGSGNDPPPTIFSIPPVVPSARPCAAEIDRALASAKSAFGGQHTTSSRTYYDENVKSWSSASCASIASLNVQAMVKQADVQLADATERLERAKRAAPNSQSVLEAQSKVDHFAFSACMVRAGASLCKASVAPPPTNVSAGADRPVPARPVPPNASGNAAADTQQLTAQVSNAIALFEKRRADIDMARKGKPKLHKSGSVAHHCLKPQPGGGMLNDCPYAVEYHYCVFRPRKESWAVGLDCEKNQGGAWQVGRGPGTPVLMHLGGGEITYWFACRYGDTLQKPDGISPADIEFQDGRGLLGRCAEWGSKRG